MDEYAKIISTCCYIRSRGKILMLYRNKIDKLFGKRWYRGLGGKATQGESPFECVKREVKEEAGIDIEPIWKGIITFSYPHDKDWEAHVFIAQEFSGQIKESEEGELHWIEESKILNLEMPEADKKIIPLLFKEVKFHAHIKYGENKELLSLKMDII